MFGKKKKVKHEKHHTDYKVSSEKAPEERKDEFITYENVAIPEIHIKKSSNSPQDR